MLQELIMSLMSFCIPDFFCSYFLIDVILLLLLHPFNGLFSRTTWCNVLSCVFGAEEGILRDTDRTEQAIANVDPASVVSNTSNIARRAHRILQVAQSEADNSEDPQFVDHVNSAVDRLRGSALFTVLISLTGSVASKNKKWNICCRILWRLQQMWCELWSDIILMITFMPCCPLCSWPVFLFLYACIVYAEVFSDWLAIDFCWCLLFWTCALVLKQISILLQSIITKSLLWRLMSVAEVNWKSWIA